MSNRELDKKKDHGNGVIEVHYKSSTHTEEVWFKHDKYHRDDDKPATIMRHKNGDILEEWYKDGKAHRDDDKPAIVNSNGDRHWIKDDSYYERINNKPNHIKADGSWEWLDQLGNTKESWSPQEVRAFQNKEDLDSKLPIKNNIDTSKTKI